MTAGETEALSWEGIHPQGPQTSGGLGPDSQPLIPRPTPVFPSGGTGRACPTVQVEALGPRDNWWPALRERQLDFYRAGEMPWTVGQ